MLSSNLITHGQEQQKQTGLDWFCINQMKSRLREDPTVSYADPHGTLGEEKGCLGKGQPRHKNKELRINFRLEIERKFQ